MSSRARWETNAALIGRRRAEGFAPVVVCSAVSGVSNLLERLLPDAVAGRHAGTLAAIRARHQTLAAELGVAPDLVDADLADIGRVASGVALVGEFGPRLQARVMAAGELMVTRLGAA